ncbi:NADP-dependent phosphogluconate dehydrogenase [Abyssicoccus albus]|uniref:NADP-dependent phosphogluconate dehydrogenase n=1 Tax=Abyssicoccus albus TaxID=1817405 RepID=UPI00097E406A|nr:NADP-dependent phosphogluconate dehydrogenase [Abyssicoccus albus]AQL56122.1 phosphogluconate dehydrogenase (NADP(+)-dependent, decarboxylating) [Abyssicoccus albus]
MKIYDVGVVGLGVMGKNLSKNIASRGYKVAAFDYFEEVRDKMQVELNDEQDIELFHDIESFTASLKEPKNILMMVQAGQATDLTIDLLTPYLGQGDSLIDGGNANFKETIRRNIELSELGINFIGVGISGGEEGALNGPSIMPGGQLDAYQNVESILKDIAAVKNGEPCVTYIGDNGAGHYVKMIHNGIEYADMQLIAEAYSIMKTVLNMSHEEMSSIFEQWNQTELNSYLIEITSHILKYKENGEYLVEKIMDKAGQKGTGKWTAIDSLELGIPSTVISESVYARCISSLKDERIKANKLYNFKQNNNIQIDKEQVLDQLRNALYISKICTYAQGFRQMKAAEVEYGWSLPLGDIAKIWREGCIIRAEFLDEITNAFERNNQLDNLLFDDYFKSRIINHESDLREIVKLSIDTKMPIPGFSSSLTYLDQARSEQLSANMIQAQRDYFGAHTYERIDQEGKFHTEWKK